MELMFEKREWERFFCLAPCCLGIDLQFLSFLVHSWLFSCVFGGMYEWVFGKECKSAGRSRSMYCSVWVSGSICEGVPTWGSISEHVQASTSNCGCGQACLVVC